jgi:2-C-methyl-D-erythritol 4-phosphate cytidylyltransferase
MVAWSVAALAQAGSVGAIVIAAPSGFEDQVAEAVKTARATSVDSVTHTLTESTVDVVPGGETRAESVVKALEWVRSDAVVIHDAARPLIAPALIDSVLDRLMDRPDADGVIAAAPLADTVKRAREPRPLEGVFPRGGPAVAKTESRDHLWAAQTPQAFRTAALRAAFASDPRRVAAATDEAMLVEKAGGQVLIEPAPLWNLKVTTAEDLRIAELLLGRR